ncbi:MAG: hypothetical protein KF690_03420 [Bacteroidetes bacterium]|nr:hypothetical protein [Bacteroidota bacterium]
MKTKNLLFLGLFAVTALGVACGKKGAEGEKSGEKAQTEEADKCPAKSEVHVKLDTLGLDTTIQIVQATLERNKDGILDLVLHNYEGMAKAQGALKDGEINIKVKVYTDYNLKPRPEVKEGMTFGMPSEKNNNNSGSYEIQTNKATAVSWWSAFGDGGKNSFRVQVLKLNDKEVCLNLSGSCIKMKGVSASMVDGTVKTKF